MSLSTEYKIWFVEGLYIYRVMNHDFGFTSRLKGVKCLYQSIRRA